MQSFHTIVTHVRPHLDEILAILFLRRFGESRFPGVSTAKLVLWDAGPLTPDRRPASDYANEGYVLIGVGGSRFDEHATLDTDTPSGRVRRISHGARARHRRRPVLHETPRIRDRERHARWRRSIHGETAGGICTCIQASTLRCGRIPSRRADRRHEPKISERSPRGDRLDASPGSTRISNRRANTSASHARRTNAMRRSREIKCKNGQTTPARSHLFGSRTAGPVLPITSSRSARGGHLRPTAFERAGADLHQQTQPRAHESPGHREDDSAQGTTRQEHGPHDRLHRSRCRRNRRRCRRVVLPSTRRKPTEREPHVSRYATDEAHARGHPQDHHRVREPTAVREEPPIELSPGTMHTPDRSV
jgi:hypothetical protein